MRGTGVLLSQTVVDEVIQAFADASKTPVITLDSTRPDLAAVALRFAKDLLYEYALGAGLPEIQGYYGLDTVTGEVIAP